MGATGVEGADGGDAFANSLSAFDYQGTIAAECEEIAGEKSGGSGADNDGA